MTKATGRPRGRPKTKEYRSVTIRFPLEFLEQLQHYAKLKRQTMSDVLRDGAQALLADVDPYHPSFVSHINTDNLSDTKGGREAEKMSDTKAEGETDMLSDTKEIDGFMQTVSENQMHKAAASHVPDFDPTRYILGAKLCGGKHEHGNTGKTLLTLRGKKCVQCQTDKQRQRRVAARRAVQAVA